MGTREHDVCDSKSGEIYYPSVRPCTFKCLPDFKKKIPSPEGGEDIHSHGICSLNFVHCECSGRNGAQ